jgi:hypothetical protein
MTVKESFDIAGLPTTFGNPAFADNIAQTNAAVVDRLEGAGAIVLQDERPLHAHRLPKRSERGLQGGAGKAFGQFARAG